VGLGTWASAEIETVLGVGTGAAVTGGGVTTGGGGGMSAAGACSTVFTMVAATGCCALCVPPEPAQIPTAARATTPTPTPIQSGVFDFRANGTSRDPVLSTGTGTGRTTGR
jgi:hypothetical protein